MEHLRWESRPNLQNPILVAAFAGWNDAGDSATSAVGYLDEEWDGQRFADIDPEEFFDFTSTRPQVRLDTGASRNIEWPTNLLSAARTPAGNDVVFLRGVEPSLKWRTFSEAVMECVKALDVRTVITLGALLADVPHTHPAPVSAYASDPELLSRHRLRPSQYEGPTGIVGVLHHACAQQSVPSASLWAAVPHYVGQVPSPKATLALVRRATELLDVSVDTQDLEIASSSYERQVSEIVESDEDMAEYVHELEESDDQEQPSGDTLAAEVERFLRDQGT